MENPKLEKGTAVTILPEFRDSAEDASGWRVVEDRGERVVIEAVGLLSGSMANPQTVVGREMLAEIPAPESVRELVSDAELWQHGIERDDCPSDRIMLATWADRCGWYADQSAYANDADRFCAVVANESACFATAEACHAWLWARVETTS